MKNPLFFICLSLFTIGCGSFNENNYSLYKNPTFTNPKVNVEMQGYYYCSGKDFDALIILFDDGKFFFKPFIKKPNIPDTVFKYEIDLINFSLNGTIDFWGNFNIIENKLFIEYIYEDAPLMKFYIIEAFGTIIDNKTISISKIQCGKSKNKFCKQFGIKEYNPPLIFNFHSKEISLNKKSVIYENRWYRKNAWNKNELEQ